MHFMHMNGQTVSGTILEPGGLPLQSTAVLSDINPIVPYVYGALERAIADSTAFFPQGDSVDPFLFPNLVRYYAHRYLKGAPEEIDGFLIERLSNNGIFFVFGAYRIRVWKADEGQLPAPGNSDRRLEFFEQPELFPGMRLMKLAIIWDTTNKGTLRNLMLVCPKGDGNPSTEIGQVHWQIEIPHPATNIKAAEAAQVVGDDLELETPAELKIKRAASSND
jgi:hypothetical protein